MQTVKDILPLIPWSAIVWLILGVVVIRKLGPPLVEFIQRAKTFKAGSFAAEVSGAAAQQIAQESPAGVLEGQAPRAPNAPAAFEAEIAEALRPFRDYPTFQAILRELQQRLDAENLTLEQFRNLLTEGGAFFAMVLDFENIHALIFGSQIQLLQELNTGVILNLARVKSFYDDATKRFPAIYQDYKFESWLEFVKSRALVEQVEGGVRIIDKGRDFLKYIIQTAKVVTKSG